MFDVTRRSSTCDDDAVVVLIYKANHQNITSRLTTLLGVNEPTQIQIAKFTEGRGRANAKAAQRKLVEEFQRLPGKHSSNMYLGKTADVIEYTAKSLFEQ